MRQEETRERWEAERDYILGINPQDPGPSFNDDPACFNSYCAMQANFACQDGHRDLGMAIAQHRYWRPAA